MTVFYQLTCGQAEYKVPIWARVEVTNPLNYVSGRPVGHLGSIVQDHKTHFAESVNKINIADGSPSRYQCDNQLFTPVAQRGEYA